MRLHEKLTRNRPRCVAHSEAPAPPRRSLLRGSLLTLPLALALTACGAEGTASDAASAEPSAGSADTRVVEDATGTVELPVQPRRPVPTDGIWAANMLSLGIEPAALPSDVKLQLSTVADRLPEGTDLESLPEIGLQYDINLEALAAVDPDLVIASEFEAEELGDELRQIAPTYFVPQDTNGEWRSRFLGLAEALGRQEQAQAVSDDFDDLVAGLPDELDDRTVAFVRASALTDIRADVLETSFAGSVAREAGIPVLDLSDSVDVPADASWVDLSQENLGLLADADVLVVSDLSFYDPSLEPTDSVMQDSALWSSLPAVQSGDVVLVPGPVYNGGHYQAATALLEAIAATVEG